MGSKSDWEVMKPAVDALAALGIAADVRVISAHRTPQRHADYVESAAERGIEVFICGAGFAAHLAGVTAAITPLPVLGVPLDSSALQGLDALLATVQMPGAAYLTCSVASSSVCSLSVSPHRRWHRPA